MSTLNPVGNTGLYGTFDFDPSTQVLTWSEPVYRIHGFEPGDVVPSIPLALSHKHPQDREAAERLVMDVCGTGRSFSFWHRLVDAQGGTREVLSVGAGDVDDTGAVTGIHGYMVDLSEPVRRSAAREVEEAIEGVAQSRATIEQVKGALMLTYALDEDAAFGLLRRYSQLSNIKVRDVARDFIAAMRTTGFPVGSRSMWDSLAGLSTEASADPEAGERTAT